MAIARAWATPITIGAFLLMAVTGILMFFHLDTGLNKEAHEWLGWAMVLGVIAHAIANGQAFARQLSKATGQAIVGVFVLLLVGSFFVQEPGGGSPAGAAIRALVSAPISQLAALNGEPTASVVARLNKAGFQVADPNQTLSQVAGQDRAQVSKALRAALKPSPQH